MQARVDAYYDPEEQRMVVPKERGREQFLDDLAFTLAWWVYWNGLPAGEDGDPHEWERPEWLASPEREEWLGRLSAEMVERLHSTSPPEEHPRCDPGDGFPKEGE